MSPRSGARGHRSRPPSAVPHRRRSSAVSSSCHAAERCPVVGSPTACSSWSTDWHIATAHAAASIWGPAGETSGGGGFGLGTRSPHPVIATRARPRPAIRSFTARWWQDRGFGVRLYAAGLRPDRPGVHTTVRSQAPTPTVPDHGAVDDYELLDVGDGMRLERFGTRIVIRPHPGAQGPRGDPGAWRSATLKFESGRGWTGPDTGDPWQIGDRRSDHRAAPDRDGPGGPVPGTAGVVGVAPGPGCARQGRAQPVRVLRPGDAGRGDGRRIGRPRRRIPAHGRLGAAERRVVGARRAAGPLDRRRCGCLRRTRGPAWPALRRCRARPPSYGHGPRGRGWRLEDDLAPLLHQVASWSTPRRGSCC